MAEIETAFWEVSSCGSDVQSACLINRKCSEYRERLFAV